MLWQAKFTTVAISALPDLTILIAALKDLDTRIKLSMREETCSTGDKI